MIGNVNAFGKNHFNFNHFMMVHTAYTSMKWGWYGKIRVCLTVETLQRNALNSGKRCHHGKYGMQMIMMLESQ